MSKINRSDKLLVVDMLDAIRAIEEFTADIDFNAFIADRKSKDAVVRNVQVLGEAANRVSVELREANPQVEWMRIIRSRHVVVHDYFGIDYEIIWRIKEVHLPPLKADLDLILAAF